MNTKNHRMILYPLAGAALGALAGAGFGMDKGIAASAAFFGFVGFGLGYALHDFNWRRNRKTTVALALAFVTPMLALLALLASQQEFGKVVLTPASLFGIATFVAPGGLLALIIYAIANTFGLIEEAQDWPAGGAMEEDPWHVWHDGNGYTFGVEGYGHYACGMRTDSDD